VPFFTGLAQLSGCSQHEIQEAQQVASIVGRDSVYLAGIDYDVEQFKRELEQMARYIQKKAA